MTRYIETNNNSETPPTLSSNQVIQEWLSSKRKEEADCQLWGLDDKVWHYLVEANLFKYDTFSKQTTILGLQS
jgi:hypothetical protein